ncbi:hypothetical protein BH11ACT5_BH11ACT5_09340 [soil metagenome]
MTSRTAASAPERRLSRARNRLSAGLSALALVVLSVVGGAMLSASAAPASPTITSPSSGDGVLDSAAPTFTVDASSLDQDVEVWLTPDGGAAALYCAANTGALSDVASCSGALISAGGWTAEARGAATAVPGDWSPFSAGVHFVSYNNDFPMITGSPAPLGDSDVTPTLIGTGPAMGTVTVGSTPGNSDCINVPVDETGAWGCTWGVTPTNTLYSVSVSGENYLGVPIAGSGSVSFQLREPYLASITPEAVTTNYKEGLAGSKDVNTQRLVIESSPTGFGGWTVYCDLGGLSLFASTWSCPAPTGALGVADNFMRTTSYNEAGGLTLDGGPGYTNVERVVPGAPTFTAPTPLWITSSPAEDVQGGRDPGVARVVVELDTGGGNWVPYCSATSLPATNSTWGCSEPDNQLALGPNDVRLTGYTGDNLIVGTNTTTITLVAASELTTPEPGGFTNVSAPVFTGTSGWEGQFVEVRNNNGTTTYCDDEVASGIWTCLPFVAPPGDGTYTFLLYTTYSGRDFFDLPFTITIDTVAPAAPAVTAAGTTTDRTPTITGSGEPSALMTVYVNGSPAACVGGAPVVSAGGAWSCTLAASLDLDSYSISSRQTDRATNMSPLSASVSLIVTGPEELPLPVPTATPTPTPTPTATPVPFTWRLGSGLPDEVHPGDQVVLTASDLPPGLTVDAEFHSTVVALGSTSVGSNGSFALPVTVPESATPGLHHFVVTVWTPAGEAVVVEQPVTVLAFPKGTVERVAQASGGSETGAFVDRSNPGAPSSFTHGVNTVASIFSNPVVIGIAAAAGLALFLLVAFPAELLNSTISEQYPRFANRVPRAPWLKRFTNWLEKTPIVGGLAITLVAAYIFGFADPGFGFDITSFRVVLACFIALFIVGYLASVISGRIIRSRWKLDTVMELKPLGLILTIVGVALSRVLEFSPGFLLGLILGISIVGSTTAAQRAKTTLVQAGVVFALAIAGWVAYSILSATTSPDDFGTALLFDTLVAITSEGLTAVFIGMLPVKFLDGPAVFEYSKPLWAAAFIAAAAAFVVVIVPSAWGELNGSLWVWIAVVAAFALVALGIYLYFRFWAPPIEEDAEEPQSVTVGNRE